MCTHGNKYVTLRNLTGNEPVGDAVDLASMVISVWGPQEGARFEDRVRPHSAFSRESPVRFRTCNKINKRVQLEIRRLMYRIYVLCPPS